MSCCSDEVKLGIYMATNPIATVGSVVTVAIGSLHFGKQDKKIMACFRTSMIVFNIITALGLGCLVGGLGYVAYRYPIAFRNWLAHTTMGARIGMGVGAFCATVIGISSVVGTAWFCIVKPSACWNK